MSGTRQAQVHRKTSETDVYVFLGLDNGSSPSSAAPVGTAPADAGAGAPDISAGCGFLEHMLRLLAFHGRLNLKIHAAGDVEVDYHHLVEDVGICMGQALREALGDRQGIARFGSAVVPMDDALCMAVVDLSGRPYLHFNAPMPCAKVGDFDTELVEEFMRALANHGQLTLHIDLLHGSNTHHVVEATFKALALALRQAVAIDATQCVPSTKGVL
jgi:imidazoleglycerol-phosphate dehydratase